MRKFLMAGLAGLSIAVPAYSQEVTSITLQFLCLPSLEASIATLNEVGSGEGVDFRAVEDDVDAWTDGGSVFTVDVLGWNHEGLIFLRDATHGYTAILRKGVGWDGQPGYCPLITYRPVRPGENEQGEPT